MKDQKAIVQVIEKLCKENKLGKKAVQKYFYLIERKGIDFSLDYSIHYFGPYSSKLDNALTFFMHKEIINIDSTGITHYISVLDSSNCEGQGLDKPDESEVDKVISIFSKYSAFDLEGIATTDYVATKIADMKELSDDEIVSGVMRIKGSKFSNQQISQYLNILKDNDYLPPKMVCAV
jgi:hypothetical protein